MTRDDEFRHAFETMTDRLRDAIDRELRTVVDEGKAAAERLAAARVADAVAGTEARLQIDADRRAGDAADAARAAAMREGEARVAEAVTAAETRIRAEATEQAHATAADAVATAEARLRTQAEWDLIDAVDAAVATALVDAHAADRAAGERLVDGVRAIDRSRSLSETLDTLTSCAGREAARAALLLVRGGELHGWRFIGFPPAVAAAPTVVVLLDQAGVIAEAVRTGTAALGSTAVHTTALPFADLPDGRRSVAVPIAMSGEVVAVLYADEGPADEGDRPAAATWPGTVEVLARHAARCLEALTAFKAARLLTERPELPAVPVPHGAEQFPGEQDEAARRYARLLVSEIKLYHEPAVVAGRRERDLAIRLAPEIARARVLFERRVPSHVRGEPDHFHAELVRMLADGDASLLELKT